MSKIKSISLDCFFLTIVLGLFFFLLLPDRPLLVPDGARYSEIAREMLVLHDFITPHVNYVKYFEKPPLFFWLTALAIKIGGLNLWSVRSVNALLALLGCLLTYAIGRNLYDRKTGVLAGFILGTNFFYYIMLHVVNLDLSLSVFLALSLYAFLLSTQSENTNRKRFLVWLAFAAAACALMTKGLIGIVFPVAVISIWMLVTGLRPKLYLLSGSLIFLMLVLPWHVLVQIRNPEFFRFYIVNQHVLRYMTLEAHHYGPVWYYIPILLLGFAPWIVFLPQAIIVPVSRFFRNKTQFKNELFFIIWFVFIFAFYSFSKSKLLPYILPVVPALSILTAKYLAESKSDSWGIQFSFKCLFVLGAVIGGALWFITRIYPGLPDPYHAQLFFSFGGTILFLGICVSFLLQKRRGLMPALQALIVTIMVTFLLLLAALPYTDDHTILPLAQKLKPLLKSNDKVMTYNKYYQDLPFYLERRITVVNWTNELTYGMQHQDTHQWMLPASAFSGRWLGHKRIFLLTSREEFNTMQHDYPQAKFHLLASTKKNVLVSNF